MAVRPDERSLWEKTKDFSSGAWSSTKRIAGASELAAGKDVHVKISPVYADATMRASKFKIVETIGDVTRTRTIRNPTGS